MSSEFVLTLTEKEQKFIEEYQQLIIENEGDEKLVNTLIRYLFKEITNYKDLIKHLYDGVKSKIFYDKHNKEFNPPFKISKEFIKFVQEKNINFAIPLLQLSFSSYAKYTNIKIRNNYVLSSGSDGIVRVWIFDEIKDRFFLLGEYGEKQNKEVHYDLVGDFIFYSYDKTIIGSHLFTKKIVIKEKLEANIQDIDADSEKLIVYSDGIAQKFLIKENILQGHISSKYTNLNKKEVLGNIKNKKYVFVKDGDIYFTNYNEKIPADNFINSVIFAADGKSFSTNNNLFFEYGYLSKNNILPIDGIKKFDDFIQIFCKDGTQLCYHKNGELKFKVKQIPNTANMINKVKTIETPKINLYLFEDDFIIEKDGFYYGSKNWRNYLYFLENNKVCLYNEGYDYYFDIITNKNLFDEL